MILSHAHRFIFIKTRKTAGTSVEILLSRFCGDRDVITPITPEDEEYRRRDGGRGPQNCAMPFVLGAGGWTFHLPVPLGGRYSNHTPAERVRLTLPHKVWASYFKFTIVRNPYDAVISRYFWRARRRGVGSIDEINDFVLNSRAGALTNWPTYADRTNKILVDQALRYEHLKEDLAGVLPRLGIPGPVQLPRAKSQHRSNREHYSRVLSPAARSRIEQFARLELDTFGYRWESL